MKVDINKTYRHFKGGLYIVEDIALDCETLEKVVIYRALYDDNKLWVRPLDNFVEIVNKNGQKHRFERFVIEKDEKSL